MTERKDVPDIIASLEDRRITLPAQPASAALARDFIRSIYPEAAGERLEDALLCVTELVANVALHTRSSHCTVAVSGRPDEMTIEVWDDTAELPVIEPASLVAEHGRGMRIVDALADAWGIRARPDDGKAVWLRLNRH